MEWNKFDIFSNSIKNHSSFSINVFVSVEFLSLLDSLFHDQSDSSCTEHFSSYWFQYIFSLENQSYNVFTEFEEILSNPDGVLCAEFIGFFSVHEKFENLISFLDDFHDW